MEKAASAALAPFSAGLDKDHNSSTAWNNFRLNAFDLLPESFKLLHFLSRSVSVFSPSGAFNLSDAYPASVWIKPYWCFVRVTAKGSGRGRSANVNIPPFDKFVNFLHSCSVETERSVNMLSVRTAQCTTISRLALFYLISRADVRTGNFWKCIDEIREHCCFPTIDDAVSVVSRSTMIPLDADQFDMNRLRNLKHWQQAWRFGNENQRVRMIH